MNWRTYNGMVSYNRNDMMESLSIMMFANLLLMVVGTAYILYKNKDVFEYNDTTNNKSQPPTALVENN